jgi:ArsR family transcriptional regulator, arsenate/arsenite/antimonite-responsive transcriptional repressor
MKVIESLSKEDLRAAELFRALGNPARLRILREIAERKTCVTGELVDVLPLAQSTVSQHLKVLKDAGLVRGEVEGDLCYCIDETAMEWLSRFCGGLCGCDDCC